MKSIKCIKTSLLKQVQKDFHGVNNRDSVKIMAFFGRKAINNFPNPSQKMNYFPNFLKKINNGNNGKFSKAI